MFIYWPYIGWIETLDGAEFCYMKSQRHDFTIAWDTMRQVRVLNRITFKGNPNAVMIEDLDSSLGGTWVW